MKHKVLVDACRLSSVQPGQVRPEMLQSGNITLKNRSNSFEAIFPKLDKCTHIQQSPKKKLLQRCWESPSKGKGKRCSMRTAQQLDITGKHLGPAADKQAFVLPQVYISKPLRTGNQVFVSSPSRHPRHGYNEKSLHYNLNCPLPPSPWSYQPRSTSRLLRAAQETCGQHGFLRLQINSATSLVLWAAHALLRYEEYTFQPQDYSSFRLCTDT